MDLVGACTAFVHVSEQRSFTLGAAAARVPQPVASRRVAALERHLGARLFDRSTRRGELTPFGRAMLPTARRLVQLAEALEDAAEHALRTPLRVAVPETCSMLRLARLQLEAKDHGVVLEAHPAPPATRIELLQTQEIRAALVAAPADEATWHIPLGLASATDPGVDSLFLQTLRPGRGGASGPPRHVWLQPEDDVPHVRDRVYRVRDMVGLRSGQVRVAHSVPAATAAVLGSGDYLLAPPDQARELGLYWTPLGELDLARGLAVATTGGEDPDLLRSKVWTSVARCVGAVEDGAPE
ncbi:LysR family transcriptional regulator [Spiractinospora alimapuensis]|uniref:LysR family transcriptional regulator n=1 Tax=Spiractinospora alimapuensis TaxID=2820884 RepID=UPI001F190AC8|nr:LysR family transcriptional regulator [Spiractinospora alimapuensis]QVQ50872.1 LysR family transcriptional regulator [Spiractinospora alimapuensis]